MPDSEDNLVKTIKGGFENVVDWMTGDAPKRIIMDALHKRQEEKPEPFKFDGPKEKEEQKKQSAKKPVPRKRA